MLGSFRNFAKSKFAGIFVFLMIIPFVFWGMGSIFSSGYTNNLAKINDTNISTQEFIDFVKTNKTYDGLITSEIEAVISNIINKKDPKEIPGFYYKKDGNYICDNTERALANMEKLPFLKLSN